MMTVLNLKTARDRYLPPINDPNKTDFKLGNMVLLENHTLTTAFDSKCKTRYRICKCICNKAFDIQDSTGKVRCISVQHLQLLYPTDQVLTYLPDITILGQTTKYINHSKLMPNLHAHAKDRKQMYILSMKLRYSK